jgi:hypothetical protein
MSNQTSAKPLPAFFVGQAITRDRIKRFQETKQPVLTNLIGKEDTRAVWYSIEHIEELFKELKYLNANGLRIYLGSYEESHPQYSGQTCLLMVATRLNDSQKNEDLILEQGPDFESRISLQRDLEIQPEKPKERDFNYGSPCPPVCPENELKYP